MRELPSSFNPEEVTEKWTNKLLSNNLQVTNRTLFELVRDLFGLNWEYYQQYREVNFDLPEEAGKIHIDLYYEQGSEAKGYEEYSVASERYRGRENFSLRRSLKGRERFSTLWYTSAVHSVLAEGYVRDVHLVPVRLKNQHRVQIAQNLWRAHCDTVLQTQQETA